MKWGPGSLRMILLATYLIPSFLRKRVPNHYNLNRQMTFLLEVTVGASPKLGFCSLMTQPISSLLGLRLRNVLVKTRATFSVY